MKGYLPLSLLESLLFLFLVGNICVADNVEERNFFKINISKANYTFDFFKEKFNWRYEPNSDEYTLRRRNFEDSIRRHALMNSLLLDSQNASAKYGFNRFSDLSPEEFRQRYLWGKAETVPRYPGSHAVEEPPVKFDWRDKNVVTPVQDQQSCGGCWAFSVVGGIESAYARQGSPLEKLSVQQVIDCSYVNQGCNGGSTVRALSWLKQTEEKLVKQSDYPFKAVTEACRIFAPSRFGVSIKDYVAFDFSGSEGVMMQKLLEWGPLTATVDALSWQDYLRGVIQHHCSSQQANHAVLITGYDTTGEIPYWVVRNSWGGQWGNQGYVYIKMGANVCGIADSVSAVFL